MARRRNALFHRFNRMRGLPTAEKALLLRIADLMDVALNNRQASNPYEPRRNKPSRVIYPPTGLTADTGVKAVKLTWTAPPSDEHLRYEIEVLNIATGTIETKSSFTNNLTYYGSGGDYEATVRSVGRNGASSTLEKIAFDIGSDVMQIEGAKLGATELGTLVQDDILHLSGYKIFVWGAVVIDEYIAGAGNPDIVFKLWRKEGDDATFTTGGGYPLQLMETIILYPATEDASNLSADALGGQEGYVRYPVPEALGSVRPGSFGTSQSVMFSPIKVPKADADKRWTYFLQAINRETQSDEVSLSITIWAGAEGAAEAQPGQDYVEPSPYNPLHFNHFHTWNHHDSDGEMSQFVWDSRWAVSQVLEGYALTANHWTLAIWWRPDRLDPQAQLGDPVNYPGSMRIYQRESLVHEAPWDVTHNQIRLFFSTRIRDKNVEWQGSYDELDWVHQMDIHINSNEGLDADPEDEASLQYQGINLSIRSLVMDEEEGQSALMPWRVYPLGDDYWDTQYMDITNNGWYFTMICFDGSFNTDPDGQSKVRVWHNNGVSTDIEDRFMEPPAWFHKQGMRHLEYLVTDPNDEYWENTVPEGADLRLGPMYLNSQQTIHVRPILQDDKYDRIQGFGCTLDHTHSKGQYDGSGENVQAFPIQFYQAGFWNVALDTWNGNSNAPANVGEITRQGAKQLQALYAHGHGWLRDWKLNSIEWGNETNYICAENLVSHWQFGNIPTPFELGEVLRDTGWTVYGGDANMSTTIFPHAEGFEDDSPLEPILGPNSWGNTTGIWDIRTPKERRPFFGPLPVDDPFDWGEGNGPGGTTYSNVCYPGQRLPFSHAGAT